MGQARGTPQASSHGMRWLSSISGGLPVQCAPLPSPSKPLRLIAAEREGLVAAVPGGHGGCEPCMLKRRRRPFGIVLGREAVSSGWRFPARAAAGKPEGSMQSKSVGYTAPLVTGSKCDEELHCSEHRVVTVACRGFNPRFHGTPRRKRRRKEPHH